MTSTEVISGTVSVALSSLAGGDVGGALIGASTAVIAACALWMFLGVVWLLRYGWSPRGSDVPGVK